MKKSLFLLILGAAMVFVTGCSKEPKEDISPVTTSKALINILKYDYKTVMDCYPGAENSLVEARCTLDHPITQVSSADELSLISLNEIYYRYHSDISMSHLVYIYRDFEAGTNNMQFVETETPWFGDKQIPIESLDSMISLHQAILCLMASGKSLPLTRFVTLRFPIYAIDRGHALYVFGGENAEGMHVKVDSYTGEVYLDEQ